MSSKIQRFTYISGPDDFLVNRVAKERFEQMSEGVDEFSIDVLSGFANNVGEVEAVTNRLREAVQTLGLFGARKAVWLKEVNFLADSQTGKAEGTLKQVEELKVLLESIDPEEIGLLVSASPVDRRRSFPKWCEKNSDSRVVAEGSGGMNWEALVAEECHNLDVSFGPGVIELLVARINRNARLFVEEVRKLITYCDESGGVISQRMVDELVPAYGEGDFFETAEAFFSRDLSWSIEALRRHFFAGYDARPLLSAFQNRNRLLIQIRSLVDSGSLRVDERGMDKSSFSSSIARYGQVFGSSTEKNPLNVFTQNAWYLGKLAGRSRLPSLRFLIDHQFEFRRAFEEIIERPNEQEEVLRAMMVRCLAPGKAA
ncbi:MAG: DNA polymerase III subunit delta [Verrucomicrobia bacterium]|nr:MAG: DNA polymerase III subunit delta [Verrucomicrobiota bacterium]